VLTWWPGTGLGGLSSGTDYIDNDHFQQIATVIAGNGSAASRGRRRCACTATPPGRLHLLPSMMVSAVAATALTWPVSGFSGAMLV
jgi:hypothetical protein